jgi:hypothetical protein
MPFTKTETSGQRNITAAPFNVLYYAFYTNCLFLRSHGKRKTVGKVQTIKVCKARDLDGIADMLIK